MSVQFSIVCRAILAARRSISIFAHIIIGVQRCYWYGLGGVYVLTCNVFQPTAILIEIHKFVFYLLASLFYFRPSYILSQDLVKKLLTVEPKDRLTASEACEHQWFHTEGRELSPHSLRGGLENLKVFNAKRKFRAAVDSVRNHD